MRLHAMTQPAAYDAIAERYREWKWLPFRHYIERHTIAALLGDLQDRTVLDLACGEGAYARELKRSVAVAVTGVDLSKQKMLAHELGHALGLYYVAPGQGFVMTSGHPANWSVAEQLISQTAFEVRPSVMYPRVVPPAPVPALPLAGLLLLVAAPLWSARRRMAQDGQV